MLSLLKKHMGVFRQALALIRYLIRSNPMKKYGFFLICLYVLLAGVARAQPGAMNLGQLIDIPVAKTLMKGGVSAEIRAYPEGGILGGVMVGLTDYIDMGVSYGGINIIGSGKPKLNPLPCVQFQYLTIEEQNLVPALLIGFSSQGYGEYNKDLKRYAVKSRGFYAVLSKNTAFLGGLGLHAGLNYSLEKEDGDDDINAFVGLHKWINPDLVLMCEYDAAINDNADNSIGAGKGYLNAGIRWSVAGRFFLEFAWKNILENRFNVPGSSREIKLVYLANLLE